MSARDDIAAHFTSDTLSNSLLDAFEGEVRTKILGDDLNPSNLVLDAQAYRQLADAITATMTDPDRWDGDDDEGTILARYVVWLAAGRAVVRAEEWGKAADEIESDSWSRRDKWGRYEEEEREAGMRAAADLLRRLADEPGTDTPPGKPTQDAGLTVYRTSHESITFGHYTTAAAAREHCETYVRREQPDASLDWIEDEEDGIAELAVTVDGEESDTGYVVTALEVASAYDPNAEE